MIRWTTVQSAVYTRGMARWQPKERRMNQISRKNRGLTTLLATAHALNRLDARLRKALPDSMRSHNGDRKSTRLNSSHVAISYAVFCLKKKNMIKSIITMKHDCKFDVQEHH